MRRVTWWTLAVGVAVTLPWRAGAQVRLPVVPLPGVPLQSLQRSLGQTDALALDSLSEARHRAISALIHANPRAVGRDAHGEAVVRNEILAQSPSDTGLAAARALGLEMVREEVLGDLDWKLVVFRVPDGVPLEKTLRKLQAADSAGSYDLNHLYLGGGVARARDDAGVNEQGPEAAPDVAAMAATRVGLIDSGVDGSQPLFRSATVHRWGCPQGVVPDAHGTAVASLLVGHSAAFNGVLPSATLYAADVYCGRPTGGAMDALARAFGWMVSERVAVINVSLVGPDNVVFKSLVAALTAKGYLIVAAVGNDGPAAPPLYPAAYPHVVGVTGVDARHRVLLEAARGAQVQFAAPGADMAAGALGAAFAEVRGTSFAAPIVAGLLARRLAQPDAEHADTVVQALAREAADLGPPGRDFTYGYGLIGAAYAVDPKPLIGRH